MGKLSELSKKRDFQKIKLLSGKSIGITPWKIKEEKVLLFAVETRRDDKELLIDESLKLMKSCVDRPELFDKLSKSDILYILIQLRKLSKTKNAEFEWKCQNEECKTYVKFNSEKAKKLGVIGENSITNEDKIDVEKDIDIKHFDETSIKIGEFKIFPKEISFKNQRKMEDKFLPDGKFNAFNYELIINSISKITVGEKIYEKFTKEELIIFLDDNFSSEDYQELTKEIHKRSSKCIIKKKVKCNLCGKETDVVYDEMFSLFVF